MQLPRNKDGEFDILRWQEEKENQEEKEEKKEDKKKRQD